MSNRAVTLVNSAKNLTYKLIMGSNLYLCLFDNKVYINNALIYFFFIFFFNIFQK